MRAFYFGVGDNYSGHAWWEPAAQKRDVLVRSHGHADSILGPIARCIDGVFAPSTVQGQAQIVRFENPGRRHAYTLLAFADYSGDSRPGSNSVFVVEGELSFAEMERWTRTLFPTVWARFTFQVTEWRPR